MNITRTKVTEYKVLDHGIDGSQYFPGCGTAFTPYEHVVTGCGDNPAEALDDALEQIAEQGFDAEALEAQILEAEGWDKMPDKPSASETFLKANPDAEDCEESELYYYLSIRWN